VLGYISFYWGRTPQEYRLLAQAIRASNQWDEYFKKKTPEMVSGAEPKQ